MSEQTGTKTTQRLGPFEVVSSPGAVPEGQNNSEGEVIERNLDCQNYEKCLDLAAALDWSTFTCQGCDGEINESLKWRAGQNTKKDPLAKAICGEPAFNCITTPPKASSSDTKNQP